MAELVKLFLFYFLYYKTNLSAVVRKLENFPLSNCNLFKYACRKFASPFPFHSTEYLSQQKPTHILKKTTNQKIQQILVSRVALGLAWAFDFALTQCAFSFLSRREQAVFIRGLKKCARIFACVHLCVCVCVCVSVCVCVCRWGV